MANYSGSAGRSKGTPLSGTALRLAPIGDVPRGMLKEMERVLGWNAGSVLDAILHDYAARVVAEESVLGRVIVSAFWTDGEGKPALGRDLFDKLIAEHTKALRAMVGREAPCNS
jgi:hypothetical protein